MIILGFLKVIGSSPKPWVVTVTFVGHSFLQSLIHFLQYIIIVFQKPIEGIGETMAGTLCCKSGPISGHISVAKRGYVCGQNIPFKVHIQNNSKKPVPGVRVSLMQVSWPCIYYKCKQFSLQNCFFL